MMPELNVYGEFLLDIDEWDKIHFIDLHGRKRLIEIGQLCLAITFLKYIQHTFLNSIIIGLKVFKLQNKFAIFSCMCWM